MVDGVNIYGWISLVERYFRIGGFLHPEKMDWVSVHLAGDALGWYHWEINRLPFSSWFHFKERLLLRFGNLRIKGPSQSLFCIKQDGTIADYVRKFEDLSAQVSGLDDLKLEGIFLNGLKPEMQELVYMMKSQSLPELIVVAMSMETSTLRKVMQKELSSAGLEKKPGITKSKVSAPLPLTSWKSRSTIAEVTRGPDKTIPDKVTGKPMQRPQKRHSNAKLDDMRRRSI